MHDINKVKFTGGLNTDDDVRTLPPLDYVYAKNIKNAINEAGKQGAAINPKGNVKITKYTLPYSGNVFPNGQNICIGAFEEQRDNTVIFCVWNSNKKHQILRYYRNNTNPDNPYGVVQQIVQYDFGWTKKTRITSGSIVYGNTTNGDLFYFTDPIPKKINLTKGNICNKHKSWNIYAGQTNVFGSAGVFNFFISDFNFQVIALTGVQVPAYPNNTDALKFIADQLNLNYNQYITATACDCHLQITEVGTNAFHYEAAGYPLLCVPDNWYGNNLIYRYVDRCKYPALTAPQCLYKEDASFLPNYVQKKVFQFRLEYLYDDLEQSVFGVWSQIPINNLSCDGTDNALYNYIDIDFNDTNLFDPNVLVLLKKVRVIARELNTGTDREVITLEPCDFLDYINGAWVCHFKFYNDILSSSVDPVLAAREYDPVPLTAGAEIFSKNRMIEGNILEGYDAPECPTASYTIDFAPNPVPKLFKVTFKIRIRTYGLSDEEQSDSDGLGFESMFPNYKLYPFWQSSNPYKTTAIDRGGIFGNAAIAGSTNGAFFGGGGYGRGAGFDFGIRSGMTTIFDQRIPEGGFPVYFAGTPYFGISRQIGIGRPTDGSGALNVSSAENIAGIGNYLALSTNLNDLYSTVTINVPSGEYIARVASHWCSFGDTLQKGFLYNLSAGTNYQKTSTNVIGCYAPGGSPYDQNSWLKTRELKIIVTGDIADAGTFVIGDLAPPWDANVGDQRNDTIWRPLNAYLYDSNADDGGNSNSDANSPTFDGLSVEKTAIIIRDIQGGDNRWMYGAITDHNGYFFGINNTAFAFNGTQVGGNICTTTIVYTGSLSQLFTKTLVPYDLGPNVANNTPFSTGLVYGIVTTTASNSRLLSSTFVKGGVVDGNGNSLGGVLVVYENGRTFQTQQDGSYEILAWGDMLTPNLPVFPIGSGFIPGTNRVVDNLLFELSVFCQPTYPNGQEFSPIAINPYGVGPSQYNPAFPYIVPNFTINENNNPAQKAEKRGGKKSWALKYYDNAGRVCSPVKVFDIYTPFETEDLHLTLPNQYPVGTYKQGKPTIKWALPSSFRPPQFAAYYQWMRTKDAIYGRYLQWVANQVVYLSAAATATTPEIVTSFNNGDAVAIKISLSNITTFYAANNDSQIGYSFLAGDRLRLIADRFLNYYVGINDFQITAFDSPTQSIIIRPSGFQLEIKSGTLLEIFNPVALSTTDEQIYYEVGEVFKCTNPGMTNNEHGTLSGTFTNGDTYWRGRLIIVNDEDTKYGAAYPVTVEDPSVSDFYPSLAQDIGRPGVIDESFRQIYRPMLMRFSNAYIPETAINGLSSFEALNQKELDRSYGAIQRFVFTENNLVVVGSNREISNYIGQVTIRESSAPGGILSVSDSFLGTDYVHSQALGTDFPATIVPQNGMIFGFTNIRSNLWRYQGNGESVISDLKMNNFFNQLTQDGVSDAVAVYHRRDEMYIITYRRNYMQQIIVNAGSTGSVVIQYDTEPPFLTFDDVTIQYLSGSTWITVTGQINDIHQDEQDLKFYVQINTDSAIPVLTGRSINFIYSLPETLAWFEGNEATKSQGQGNRWKAFFDFAPENYAPIGSEIVSFKDGQIWIHDKNETRNNFYGIQYTSKITPVFNKNPDEMKVWNSCTILSRQDNNKNDWAAPNITNNNGQQSRLKKPSFAKIQEYWCAPFKRDLNTVGVAIPIIDGRPLISTSLVVELENDYTGDVVLFGWDANYSFSERIAGK